MDHDSDFSDERFIIPSRPRPAVRKTAPRPPRPKVFQCQHCERCFDRPSLLAQHILIHTGERPHQCPKCKDKRFSRTSNLYRHMRTCKGKRKQPNASGSATTHASDSPLRLTINDQLSPLPSPSPSPIASEEPSHPPSPLSEKDIPVRGVSPDPSWGPNPLASWRPSAKLRRYTVPTFLTPIAQRVPVSGASNGSGSVQTPGTTPSPSSLVPAKPTSSPSEPMGVLTDDAQSNTTTHSLQSYGSTLVSDGSDMVSTHVPFLFSQSAYAPQQQQQQQRQPHQPQQPLPPQAQSQHQDQSQGYGSAATLSAVADQVRFHTSRYRSVHSGPMLNSGDLSGNQQYLSPANQFPASSSPSASSSTERVPIAAAVPLSGSGNNYEMMARYASDLQRAQRQQLQKQREEAQAEVEWASLSASLMNDAPGGLAALNAAAAAAMGADSSSQQGRGGNAPADNMWNEFMNMA
ncbi:hypothetical protein DL93DRAFT_2163376 [Clavulina sp. PMI_390]|nr:hypothetical protein DL93DRAFT_2163376 [Clavulina sp. PMI_390]